jgi:hypothetical protein
MSKFVSPKTFQSDKRGYTVTYTRTEGMSVVTGTAFARVALPLSSKWLNNVTPSYALDNYLYLRGCTPFITQI